MLQFDERLINFAKNPESGPRVVVMGGGTGLSMLLRGLKLYSHNLTAIVTVADNGGSSGMLREDLGMLPPGDIRNCIIALADTEPLLSDLFNFRFTEGRLQGQSFGNLFIAAMNGVCGNFSDAVRNVSKVLAVQGRVLPVSLQDIHLQAQLADGTSIVGETEIGSRIATTSNRIEKISMNPADARALPEALDAIARAEILVLGPGSLYTSIIPNLLFPEIVQAILASQAVKVYVSNIMTQPAETLGYDATDHVQAMLRHAGRKTATGLIDHCITNNAWIEEPLIRKYQLESAIPVVTDIDALQALGINVLQSPLACVSSGVIRHDHTLLARLILGLGLAR
ncbi:MAG: YvcK family protein [Eubacteriales bacterium]|nr:YvcK family protein [Eubacteriales bacterium]